MSYKTTVYKGCVNEMTIIGGLKEVPELRETEVGYVATASFATKWSSKNKETQEYEDHTEWHKVILYNQFAEKVVNIGRAGMRFLIKGPAQTRSYENKEGQKFFVHEVVAKEFDPFDSILEKNSEKLEETSNENNA